MALSGVRSEVAAVLTASAAATARYLKDIFFFSLGSIPNPRAVSHARGNRGPAKGGLHVCAL